MRQFWLCAVLLASACDPESSGALLVGLQDEDFGAGAVLFNPARARVVEVPGTSLSVALWEGQLEGGGSAYAVRRAGAGFGPARRARHEVVFRDGSMDPLTLADAEPSSLNLVQFITSVQGEYVDALAAMGARPLRAFPYQALLVHMREEVREQVARQPYVRAVVPFPSRHKIDLGGFDGVRPREYVVLPSSLAPEARASLLARLVELGAVVEPPPTGPSLLRATLDGDQLRQAAAWPEVLHLEPWAEAEGDVDKARAMSGADFVEHGLGLRGQGVQGEVMDGNVMQTHPDLSNRGLVFHGEHSGDDSHGTCTTGLVFGDGTGRAAARGLLPEGRPIFAGNRQVANIQVSRSQHTRELVAQPYQAVFQSNSWGSGLTQQYTAISAELDQIVFDTDLLVFNSMSNTGNRMVRPQAWSKNVVSIGGVNHQDTLDAGDDAWDHGGSIGPAADGRLKPDLAHFWDRTLAPSNDGAYTEDFGGTSGATPITAGLAGLFMQMWSQGVFGNPTPGDTVFANRPHFTTAKAMLINTATQWTFDGATHDLTRVHQGWGRVDLERMVKLRNHLLVVDESELLTAGASKRYTVVVRPQTPVFHATLTWADPPALPAAGVHRVNDLTLKVTDPTGAVYFGNNGLAAGMASTSGGVANSVDTVENVIVPSPAAGEWLVEVRADEVAQDGHIETAAMDADFALVVSGIEVAPRPNQPPVIGLVAPTEGATLSGVITVRAAASDPDGQVVGVRFGLPDGRFVDDSSEPYEVTFDTTSVAEGEAQFTAIATDDAGATSTLTLVGVKIRNRTNSPPSVSLKVLPGEVSGSVTITASAADSDGTVARVEFALPGGTIFVDTDSPFSVAFDTRTVANGDYMVQAVAFDDRGAASLPAREPMVIDNAPNWRVDSRRKLGLRDGAKRCDVLNVARPGNAARAKVAFSLRHTYRGALRVTLAHGTHTEVLLEAGSMSASAGEVQYALRAVPGFTGGAEGPWRLCVEDVDGHLDEGTLRSWTVGP